MKKFHKYQFLDTGAGIAKSHIGKPKFGNIPTPENLLAETPRGYPPL